MPHDERPGWQRPQDHPCLIFFTCGAGVDMPPSLTAAPQQVERDSLWTILQRMSPCKLVCRTFHPCCLTLPARCNGGHSTVRYSYVHVIPQPLARVHVCPANRRTNTRSASSSAAASASCSVSSSPSGWQSHLPPLCAPRRLCRTRWRCVPGPASHRRNTRAAFVYPHDQGPRRPMDRHVHRCLRSWRLALPLPCRRHGRP